MQQPKPTEPKDNKPHSTPPTHSQPLKQKQPPTSNTQPHIPTQKSATKLPPLKKPRTDQPLQKSAQTSIAQRKASEQERRVGQAQNSYIVRKVQNKPQKVEKKKTLHELFKPEIISRYWQYLSFIQCVNVSNNLCVRQKEELERPYVLYVGKGNNGVLIKNIFRNTRPWWIVEEDSSSTSINLHWYQLRQNSIIQGLKSQKQQFDKMDYHVQQLPAEQKPMQQSLQQSQTKPDQRSNQRSHSVVVKELNYMTTVKRQNNLQKRSSSRTKTFNKSSDKIIRQSPSIKNHALKDLKQEALVDSENNANGKKSLMNPKMWAVFMLYRKIFSGPDMKRLKKFNVFNEDGKIIRKILRNNMTTIQNNSHKIVMHNHLENNWNLSNKKALFFNVRNYFQLKNINPFDYIPITFHVQKMGDKQYQSFVEQYHRRCDQIAQDEKNTKKNQYKAAFKPKKRNAWLVKPGENTNRGIGIQVVESLQQIKEILTKDNIDDQGRPRTHIIQEYIMPFLYQKRKFDIRCYILITSVNGVQKGYWYQDGYIRTACKEFNMKNLANKMIHLTNDAVQKKCEDYGKYEPGNKLSFADFQRYLDNNYNNIQNGPKFKFWNQAYPQMKKLATDAIKSVYTKINPHSKQFSFQIFGLDFLIDENFKVWLIQANTNPCLELSSPLLGRIIPSMLENAFKIAVDPVFPPPSLIQIGKLTKKVFMPENSIQNNKFQLVFDQVQQAKQLGALLTNGPQLKIYNIQEQQEEYLDQDKQNCYVQ